MVITRLEIQRFKCWRRARFDFKPGLNVVRGPNESGKSTLRAALMAVLFGNPTSSSETVQDWTSWGQAERCELKLEYTDHAGRACQLRKDFAGRKIFLHENEESFRTFKTIQAKITEELGISTEDFYNLCSSLDVRSLSDLGTAASRKQIGKILSSLMTGAVSGRDALLVLKRLEDALRELGKGLRSPSKVPGPIKSAQDRLTQLSAESAEARRILTLRGERLRELEELSRILEKEGSRLSDLDHLIEVNLKLAEADRNKALLIEQDARFEQAVELRKRIESELEELNQRLKNEAAAGFSMEEISELQDLIGRQRRLDERLPAEPSRDAASKILLVLGMSVFVIGVGLSPFKAWIGISLLLSGTAAFLAGWQRKKITNRRKHDFECRLNLFREEKEDLEKRIRSLNVRAGGLSPEEVFNSWPQSQKLSARQEALQSQLHELEPVDQEKWKVVRRELRLVEDILNDPQMVGLLLPASKLAGSQREQKELGARLSGRRQQAARLQAILEHEQSGSDKLSGLEEETAEIQQRLAYLRKREDICRLVFELLDRARKDTLNPARKVLEEQAGKLLHAFSSGRYGKIAVDDEDLSSKILITETGKWENPTVLSQGTFDQFYLGLRLALSEVLSSGKNPPLLLDEPLTALDSGRQAATLECLLRFARQRQIIFFTCRSEYDPAADQIIELSGGITDA